MRIKVIGCGGVASWLFHPLCKFLFYSIKNVELTLIDGDKYEERNKDRQVFDESGLNKAIATKNLLEGEYGDRIYFFAEPTYLGQQNAIELIRESDILLTCVDNHPSRKIISNRCEQLKNVVCIAGGNDYIDGSIQCHVREGGKNITLPLANEFHPEILNPKVDNHPETLARMRGCEAEAKSPDQGQLVFTNMTVASLMLNAFYALMIKKLNYDEVYFNIIENVCRVERRTLTLGETKWVM
jgi:hypothetical protein